MSNLHITLISEKIFTILGIPITNAILTTWLVMIFLIVSSLIVTSNLKTIPNNIQIIFELIVGELYKTFKEVTSEKNISKFFPLLASIFIFIIIANWSGLLPGIGSIGLRSGEEFLPFFKSANADLNTTLALAIIAFFSLQYYGISNLGASYFKKFINIKSPMGFFVGILDIISELSKIISFSFRLFGNVFAGEVLLAVVGSLVPIIAPLPFLGLEIFVGFIQALVFSMLTAVFLNMATSAVEH